MSTHHLDTPGVRLARTGDAHRPRSNRVAVPMAEWLSALVAVLALLTLQIPGDSPDTNSRQPVDAPEVFATAPLLAPTTFPLAPAGMLMHGPLIGLTARLLDDRGRTGLPGNDAVAANQPLRVGAGSRSVTQLIDPGLPNTQMSARGSSPVAGTQLAVGAPEASRKTTSSDSVSSTRTPGSSSATLADLATGLGADGLSLPRLERTTAALHSSIRPLVRPG